MCRFAFQVYGNDGDGSAGAFSLQGAGANGDAMETDDFDSGYVGKGKGKGKCRESGGRGGGAAAATAKVAMGNGVKAGEGVDGQQTAMVSGEVYSGGGEGGYGCCWLPCLFYTRCTVNSMLLIPSALLIYQIYILCLFPERNTE